MPKNVFHFVDSRTLWSSARKPFWPGSHGGRQIHVSEFQNILKSQRGKIYVALRLLNDPENGLDRLTYLGQKLLANLNPDRELANYLYLTGTIHPRFFAESIHVIASNSKALAPHLLKVQLKNLGRERLKRALDSGAVTTREIAREFDRFGSKPTLAKLYILERLGVLQFKAGSKIADAFPAKQEPAPDPQLDLFKGR